VGTNPTDITSSQNITISPDALGTIALCGQSTEIYSNFVKFVGPQPVDMTSTSDITIKTAGTSVLNGGTTVNIKTDSSGMITLDPTTNGTVTLCGGTLTSLATYIYLSNLSTGSDQALNISATTGQVLRNTSSLKYKENVTPLNFDSAAIYDMTAVSFRWIEQQKQDFGYIAEEAYKAVPQLVSCVDGTPDGFNYSLLSVLIMEELKKIKVRLDNAGL
jgi:hypothetical protein